MVSGALADGKLAVVGHDVRGAAEVVSPADLRGLTRHVGIVGDVTDVAVRGRIGGVAGGLGQVEHVHVVGIPDGGLVLGRRCDGGVAVVDVDLRVGAGAHAVDGRQPDPGDNLPADPVVLLELVVQSRHAVRSGEDDVVPARVLDVTAVGCVHEGAVRQADQERVAGKGRDRRSGSRRRLDRHAAEGQLLRCAIRESPLEEGACRSPSQRPDAEDVVGRRGIARPEVPPVGLLVLCLGCDRVVVPLGERPDGDLAVRARHGEYLQRIARRSRIRG